MTRRAALVCIAVAASCSQPAPATDRIDNSGSSEPAPPDPTVHRISGTWDRGAGCTPKGDELTLTGTLIVRPFGKGTDGAVLDVGGAEWILDYRAEGPLLALAGKRVVVTGRACDKQGESIYGQHFDLATLAASK